MIFKEAVSSCSFRLTFKLLPPFSTHMHDGDMRTHQVNGIGGSFNLLKLLILLKNKTSVEDIKSSLQIQNLNIYNCSEYCCS